MYLIIDLGTSEADVPAIVETMKDSKEASIRYTEHGLPGHSAVGVKVVGLVDEKFEGLVPYLTGTAT